MKKLLRIISGIYLIFLPSFAFSQNSAPFKDTLFYRFPHSIVERGIAEGFFTYKSINISSYYVIEDSLTVDLNNDAADDMVLRLAPTYLYEENLQSDSLADSMCFRPMLVLLQNPQTGNFTIQDVYYQQYDGAGGVMSCYNGMQRSTEGFKTFYQAGAHYNWEFIVSYIFDQDTLFVKDIINRCKYNIAEFDTVIKTNFNQTPAVAINIKSYLEDSCLCCQIWPEPRDETTTKDSSSQWLDSAICRPDNAYYTFVDTSSPRSSVPIELRKIFQQHYQPHHPSLRNQIFEIHHRNLFLFVVRYNEAGVETQENYYFWLYNPKTGEVSQQPFTIVGTWIANGEEGFDVKLMTRPLIELKRKKMVIRERRHNGNAYNAIIQYAITYDKRLNWQIKYVVEEKSLVVIPESTEMPIIISRHCKGNKVYSFGLYTLRNSNTEKIGEYKIVKHGSICNVKVGQKCQYAGVIVSSYPVDPIGYMEQLWKQKHGCDTYK